MEEGERRRADALREAITEGAQALHRGVELVAVQDARRRIAEAELQTIARALTTIAATGSTSSGGWYTNFARFYGSRTEPIVLRLLEDASMRAVLFDRPDADLAAALREVDRMAQGEGFSYNGWHGFSSPRIEQFIAEHLAA